MTSVDSSAWGSTNGPGTSRVSRIRYALVQTLRSHLAGGPSRGGGDQPSPLGARGIRASVDGGSLHVAAIGRKSQGEDRGRDPAGDEPDRGPGVHHAHHAPGRDLAKVGPVGQDGAGD